MDKLKKYVDYLLYSIIFILLTLVLGIILMCFIAGTSAVTYRGSGSEAVTSGKPIS
jgi:hypothetical protein